MEEALVRRIVNAIRILEHATCTAGGGVIALEDDVPKATNELGLGNPLSNELRKLGKLSDEISDAAADLHEKLTDIATANNVSIPTDRLVNTGGGTGKGP